MKLKSEYRMCYEKTCFGDILLETIFENSTSFDSGRKELQDLHDMERSVLQFNAKRAETKLVDVLETMRENLSRTKEDTVQELSGTRVIEKIQKHQDEMKNLLKEKYELENEYGQILANVQQEVFKAQRMKVDLELKLQEAHQKDNLENEYHDEVEKALQDMNRLEKFTKTLEKLKINIELESLNLVRFTYIQHVIENIRLLVLSFHNFATHFIRNWNLVIENDSHVEERVKIMKDLKNYSEAEICEMFERLKTIEYSAMNFPTEMLIFELNELIGKLKRFSKIGKEIRTVVPNHHRQKLLAEIKTFRFSDFMTIFLISFVFLLVVILLDIIC